AVLEPRGRADRPVLLQRLVRRIGDHQVGRLGRQRAQPRHRVVLREVKLQRHGRAVDAPALARRSDNPFSADGDPCPGARPPLTGAAAGPWISYWPSTDSRPALSANTWPA